MLRAVPQTTRGAVLLANNSKHLQQHSTGGNRSPHLPTRCLASLLGRDGRSTVPENRLQSLMPSTHGMMIRQDFSTGMIPLYPMTIGPSASASRIIRSNTKIKRIGIRWFTTENKKPPPEDSDAAATPQEHSSNNNNTSGGPSNLSGESSPRKLKNFVGSMGKQVNDRLNTGDLMSVYGILTLIVVVLVGPFVVGHMRNSDSTYDEDFDGEDPVAEMAKVVRDEFGVGGEGLLSSVGVGGLDSIIADLLKSPRVQQGVSDLVTKVLSSPEFKRTTQILLRELWNDLVNDPETLAQVIHLLQNVIQDENIKEAAIQLVMEVFNDREILDELVILLERLGQEKQVLAATQALLVESAHNALNDPEILDHSMEFATDVVGDDIVQQTAGEALYNTFSYAVRPTLSVVLSIAGAALILLSISAFRNAYISERSIDDTLAVAFQNSADMISTILSLPKTLLVACKNAIVSVLLFPFRMVAAGLRRLGAAGNATLDTVNRLLEYMAALPLRFYQALAKTLQHGFQVVVEGTKNHSKQLSTTISASFLGASYRSLVEAWSETLTLLQQALINMKVVTIEASSTVDDALRGTIGSLQGSLSNIALTFGKTQQSLDQSILDVYDRSYSTTAHFLKLLSNKVASTTLFQKLEEKEQLVQLKEQAINSLSSSHKSLDRLAANVGYFVEKVLASVIGLIVQRDDQSPSTDII